MIQNVTVKTVKVLEDGTLELVILGEVKDIIENRLTYDTLENIKGAVATLISQKIWEEHGEKIKNEVLTKVDWPRLVQAKIVNKTIKEIATGYQDF